ncbi:MAG: hypothetical protein L0Z62_49750 [Gemmataceae bacterium]|nr:hypothetical protein [Gemmataceae bacterium]
MGIDFAQADLSGTLYTYVAFDWGDEIDLDQARRLVPSEKQALPRRRRTPTSISYRPPPLYVVLPPVALDLPELGNVQAIAGVTLFDFAAVSVRLAVSFRLSADALRRLAGWLAEPTAFVAVARAALGPLHQQLLPAIKDPLWPDELSEEYFVFQLPPGPPLSNPAELLTCDGSGPADWLAGLVRLEAGRLSAEEVAEALRLHLSYSPDDLFVADWAAAVLLDTDCDETLQVIEFANLQLLEFRHIDNRLDDSLAGASRLLAPLARSWLPFWRSYSRPLRLLGEFKVEANGLFERAGNALKLVGDQYLARVYRLVATRFHLETWESSIQRKLEVAEGAYQVVSDQAATFRAEFLELAIVLLIVLEIVLSFRH